MELLKINPNQIEKDTVIGRGAFGVVWKGKFAGGPVAIKEVVTTMNEEKILKEITLLSKINHPNCVRLMGFYKEVNNDSKLFIVTEFIQGGDLRTVLKSNGDLPWKYRIQLAINICSGMAHLHAKNVVHRDLKSHNILVYIFFA